MVRYFKARYQILSPPKAILRFSLLFKTSDFWQNLFGSMEVFYAGPKKHLTQTDNLKCFQKKLIYNSLLSFFLLFLIRWRLIKRRDNVAAE